MITIKPTNFEAIVALVGGGVTQDADGIIHYHDGQTPPSESEIKTKLSEMEAAYNADSIDFSIYDHIVVFHAGIGQDFSLPFLDPTPEDIPSTFVDIEMLDKYLGGSLQISNAIINQGIILPETQNQLFFERFRRVLIM